METRLCKDGKPILDSRFSNLQYDANSEGFSALDACCVCGGGIQKSEYLQCIE